MTYIEFQQLIEKAGLPLREFADLVKMNRKSIYNCAKKGEVPSHLAVIATLLNAMAAQGMDYREILSKLEITPKKPRGIGFDKEER